MAAAAPLPLPQRLHFDVARGQVLDEDRRYLMMRADVFMGLFNALAPEARAQALAALADSVALHGAASVRAYAAQPGMDRERLLQAMAANAAALGWGAWTFAPDGPALRLTVANSPFAALARFDEPGACHAITGMLRALGSALWGLPCEARELHCAGAQAGPSTPGTCVFSVCSTTHPQEDPS
jgi:predicted hydrocarbon binding protein